jgi:hypothetical protein
VQLLVRVMAIGLEGYRVRVRVSRVWFEAIAGL